MRLASLLLPAEAEVFSAFSNRVAGMSNPLLDLKELVRGLQKAMREVMEDDTLTLHVKGSHAKGTQTVGSDVDIIIDTHGRCE